MVNTCSVVNCKTGYKKRKDKKDFIPEKFPVFGFPDNKPDLREKWIRFVNRREWTPGKNCGVCSKHFEAKFLKIGERVTLRWDLSPIPTIYFNEEGENKIPPSVLPTPSSSRKPPTVRTHVLLDEEKELRKRDEIKAFTDFDSSLCPEGYNFKNLDNNAIYYKMDMCGTFGIPEITETINIDQDLHVKLFYKGSPIPLPEWFRKGSDCRVTKRSMFENFPVYIRNYAENSKIPNSVMDELQEIRYKKPVGRPKYSANLLRYALLLRYTSKQAYKMLLEQFPLPSISLLKKLKQGGVEPLKAIKLLLDQGKIDKDIVLLLDEIYIEKGAQYQDGKLIGKDSDGKLYKGVMTFMIVSLKKNIPFVIKAIPETKIQGEWLSVHVDESIKSLHEIGFQVRAVISDNHSTNVSAYSHLIEEYGFSKEIHGIKHPSKPSSVIYLFYDSVHLIKNIRNNLLNHRRFIFPSFDFYQFLDPINVPAGEISWKLLHDVYDKDKSLQGNLKKAHKLSYKSLHPGDNKQSVPLALSIFDQSTSAAIQSYFENRQDASEFLKLINTWWTIVNSKQQFNSNNRIGNAATLGDNKPLFLRKFADWLEGWQNLQTPNLQKFTLTKHTCSAMIITLRCTAALIEDLLQEGYLYVLTSRFQTDALELRFSKYRQMSGGRFLVGLREIQISEQILAMRSLLKESCNIWEEDIRPETSISGELLGLDTKVDAFSKDIAECSLESESREVAVVIGGYIAKKLIKRTGCEACKLSLVATAADIVENDYLSKLSRGGLITPSADLAHYVAKSFAMLDVVEGLIFESPLAERTAAEHILRLNEYPKSFMCESHHELGAKFCNRTVVNVFYNNEQKKLSGSVREKAVKSFKQRQRKKAKFE